MTFEEMGLSAALLKAVPNEGYTTPTPIQEQSIAHVLAGRDLLGVAQTGTGKTAAFALPILDRLGPAAWTRTRYAAARPACSCSRRPASWRRRSRRAFPPMAGTPGCEQAVIYGGVSQNPQAKAVRDGVDIVVATPGRLMDLMNQGLVSLAGIEILVVDEADRMLDMGFIRDIRKIVSKLPAKRQTLTVLGHDAGGHSPTGRQHPDRTRCGCKSRPRTPRPTPSSSRCTSSRSGTSRRC